MIQHEGATSGSRLTVREGRFSRFMNRPLCTSLVREQRDSNPMDRLYIGPYTVRVVRTHGLIATECLKRLFKTTVERTGGVIGAYHMCGNTSSGQEGHTQSYIRLCRCCMTDISHQVRCLCLLNDCRNRYPNQCMP